MDNDEIRRKRLARLGGGAPVAPNVPTTSPPSSHPVPSDSAVLASPPVVVSSPELANPSSSSSFHRSDESRSFPHLVLRLNPLPSSPPTLPLIPAIQTPEDPILPNTPSSPPSQPLPLLTQPDPSDQPVLSSTPELSSSPARISAPSSERDRRADRLVSLERLSGTKPSSLSSTPTPIISKPTSQVSASPKTTPLSVPKGPTISPSPSSTATAPFEKDLSLVSYLLNVSLTQAGPNKKLWSLWTTLYDSSNPEICLPLLHLNIEEKYKSLPLQDSGNLKSLVDEVIVARLSSPLEGFSSTSMSLAYLMPCFRRCHPETRFTEGEKAVVKVVQDLLLNYSSVILECPGYFPTHEGMDDIEWVYSMISQKNNLEKSAPYLHAVFEKLEANPDPLLLSASYEHILGRVVEELRRCTSVDRALEYVQAVAFLSTRGTFCDQFVAHPQFLPSTAINGRHLERQSLLGILCRPTLVPDPDTDISDETYSGVAFFSDEKADNSPYLRTMLSSLRIALVDIFKNLLKGRDRKERVFEWVGLMTSLSARRVQLRASRSVLASDGAMVNLAAVFLKLCEPIVDKKMEMFPKLDAEYTLRPNSDLDLASETKIGVSEEEVLKIKLTVPDAEINNVTRFVSVALHLLHIGFLPACLKFAQEWNGGTSRLAHMQALMEQARATRAAEPLERLSVEMLSLVRQRGAFAAEILDPALLSSVLRFQCFVSDWLIYIANGNQFGELAFNTTESNVTGTPLRPFSFLPEYYVEDICETLNFLARFSAETADREPHVVSLVPLIVYFVASKAFLKNPYLRANIVDSVTKYSMERMGRASPFLNMIVCAPLAISQFAVSLMQFYIDVEDTDFYSKLNMRYNAQLLLKELWRNPKSREGVVQASLAAGFTRFAMLLMNDITFLLDEARGTLKKIKELKASPNQEQSELSRSEGQASVLLQLASETINMFVYISAELQAPFLKGEIVGRLAAMLNFNAKHFISESQSELTVHQGEVYGFSPLSMLGQLVHVYLNLGLSTHSEPFVEAIAADQRSYSRSMLESVASCIERSSFPYTMAQSLRSLIQRVEEWSATLAEEDDDFEDCPEEYLDILMSTVMKEPVMLPISRQIVDRSTIVSHLLSDEKDPFNRAPLKIADVIPLPDLQQKIEEWKQQRRNERAQKKKTDF